MNFPILRTRSTCRLCFPRGRRVRLPSFPQQPGYERRYSLIHQPRSVWLKLPLPHKRQKPWKPFCWVPHGSWQTPSYRRPNYARPAFLRGSAGLRSSEGEKNYTMTDGGPQFNGNRFERVVRSDPQKQLVSTLQRAEFTCSCRCEKFPRRITPFPKNLKPLHCGTH
jgi:hypothetical protein